MRAVAVAALLLAACATDAPRTRLLVARTTSSGGAPIELHRFRPEDPAAPRVVVVPELGFSPALFAPLCDRLRLAGFDTVLVVGRHALDEGPDGGWAGWVDDVARVAHLHGPRPLVLAVGVGGAAAWPLALAGAARGVVAVNVPHSPLVGTRARRELVGDLGFRPDRWLEGRPADALALLAGGRASDPALAPLLRRHARRLPPGLAAGAARVATVPGVFPLPTVPLALLVGPRDALVPSEESMSALDAPDVRFARRLGRIEAFHAHYGHLDWLASPEALDDVAPTVVDALGALK